jgi:hypothetical protein
VGELVDHVKLKQLSVNSGELFKSFLQGVAIDNTVWLVREPRHHKATELCCGKTLKGHTATTLPYAPAPEVPQQVHPYLKHPRPERVRRPQPMNVQHNPSPNLGHQIVKVVPVINSSGKVAAESRVEVLEDTPPLSLP